MFGAKVQIAVGEKGVAAEVVMVPFGLRRRYDPKDAEVLRINPKGQVPVLVDGQSQLYDSTQIFEYLEDAHPEPRLWPQDVAQRALARQLEHASDEVFFPNIIKLMSPVGDGRDHAFAQAVAYHETMDRRLHDRAFLAGDFGYADIAFFMAALFGEVLGVPITPDKRALQDWRRRVAHRPAVRSVVEPMLRFMAERKMVDDRFGERVLSLSAAGST